MSSGERKASLGLELWACCYGSWAQGPFPLIKQGSMVCTGEALVKQHLRKVSHGILASGGLGWLEPGQSGGVGHHPGRSAAVARASLWQLSVLLSRGPYPLADSVWFFSVTVTSLSV